MSTFFPRILFDWIRNFLLFSATIRGLTKRLNNYSSMNAAGNKHSSEWFTCRALLIKFLNVLHISIWVLAWSISCLAEDQAADENPTVEPGWNVDRWTVYTSVYTKHFDPDPDHVNNQKMLGFEMRMTNKWILGFAAFDNSFGQNSQYLYAGYQWQLFQSRYWYFKLTGGLLHGYKEPYEDKIPFNGLGIAPAILPSLGFRYKYFVSEFHLAGLAAATITVGITF